MAKKTRFVETAFGRYQLLELLGEGGAGRVWRGVDEAGSNVAVKVLAAERATSDRRKRFKNEILFCQRTRHPHVIYVLDHGATVSAAGPEPFYVMPLLEGSSRERLAETRNITKRLAYFDQILSGVEAAHLQNVVHRDLKPENILFDPAQSRFVVADFGVAHFQDEELYTAVETSSAARLANFAYAAPEQKRRGASIDKRTDIYALGLILNEILTGEVPHGQGHRTVGSVAPEYAWLDEIVAAMIQQHPNNRPDSIDAVKRSFVAAKQDFVVRQRLLLINQTVIAVDDEEDPLVSDPPRIVDFDWKPTGTLTLILSRPVNAQWIKALFDGHHEAIWRKGPEVFQFSGDRASVHSEYSEIQRVIDYFKGWIVRATPIYRERLAQQRQEAAQREREHLEREREELERQRRLRTEIKL